ncbi:MAG: flagellar biosynthesis protein FliQ [Alphaproteobacteria bacterium]|nr:flagellar biosynthesis protein FliQ [Alphaproteobacteria bacterium]
MNAVDIIEISRDALIVMLKISAPVMLIALIVGLSISLFQALTQIQEMTLAFVPKILVIFISLLVFMPFMLTSMTTFTQGLFDRIIALG